MTEATVLLNLPLRRVMLGSGDSCPPDWLEEEFRQMPAIVAAHRLAVSQMAASSQAQRELEQLKAERLGWSRGLAELKLAVGKVDAGLASVLDEVREATVELSLAVAEKLVFHQLASSTFPVKHLVSEVLRRLNTREPATVRLHPQDLDILKTEMGDTVSLDNEREIRLIADPALSRGDCKAVAGEITVVYELRRQIEEIRRELLSTVSGHAESGH